MCNNIVQLSFSLPLSFGKTQIALIDFTKIANIAVSVTPKHIKYCIEAKPLNSADSSNVAPPMLKHCESKIWANISVMNLLACLQNNFRVNEIFFVFKYSCLRAHTRKQ